jgi:hypothetical protein
MIHLPLLLYPKIWLNFESFQQILTHSNRFAFCSTDKFFGTSFAQIFRMCKWSVRILRNVFLSKPVSSANILTVNRRSFEDKLLRFSDTLYRQVFTLLLQ